MANGQEIYRDVGYGIIRVGDSETVDEVVFAEAGDYVLLGARALEGMALWVDARAKQLVSTGPYPVAKVIVPGKVSREKDRPPPGATGVVQGEGGPAPVVPSTARRKGSK